MEHALKVVKIAQDKDELLSIREIDIWFNEHHLLRKVSMSVPLNSITCIIGPSGAGKSTLLRSINRINLEDGFAINGSIWMNGKNLYDTDTDIYETRKNIGMVFQQPCIFPTSIYENVLFGIKHHQKLSKPEKVNIVEENLKAVSLWNEVKHRLHDKAETLSIGQQQRLSIARTLAVKPTLILMDEPTSALDPKTSLSIEELIVQLKEKYTVILVTHNIDQARRIADKVVFMCEGSVVEQGTCTDLMNNPQEKLTKGYISTSHCDC